MTGCAVVIVILFAVSLLYVLALGGAGVYDRATRARNGARSREEILAWHQHQDQVALRLAEQQAASDRVLQKQQLLQDLDRQIALARETFQPPKPSVTFAPPVTYLPPSGSVSASTPYLPSIQRRSRDESWENDL